MQNNRTTTSASSENAKPREKYNPPKVSHWEDVRFHCSVEWHFTWMTSRFAFTLYSWGRGLSFKTDSFYPSIENIAGYFGCERTTVFRALKELVSHGWAEVLHKEHGKPVRYRFVSHEEWAGVHPDCCLVKETMPYEGQGDPLGRQLHAISGGLAKFKPNQMTGLRKSGLSDDQIAAEYSAFLDRNPQKGKDWKSVYYRFRKHLLRLAADLRKVADAKNSRSDQLHRSNPNQLHGCNTTSCTEATTPVAPVQPKYLNLELEGEIEAEGTIPAPREPLSSQPTCLSERGTAPPFNPPLTEKGEMRSNRKEKESSLAPVPSHLKMSPEEKLERKSYYEDQLAKVEKSIADGIKGSKELAYYQELKVHCEQKIAELQKELEEVAA